MVSTRRYRGGQVKDAKSIPFGERWRTGGGQATGLEDRDQCENPAWQTPGRVEPWTGTWVHVQIDVLPHHQHRVWRQRCQQQRRRPAISCAVVGEWIELGCVWAVCNFVLFCGWGWLCYLGLVESSTPPQQDHGSGLQSLGSSEDAPTSRGSRACCSDTMYQTIYEHVYRYGRWQWTRPGRSLRWGVRTPPKDEAAAVAAPGPQQATGLLQGQNDRGSPGVLPAGF